MQTTTDSALGKNFIQGGDVWRAPLVFSDSNARSSYQLATHKKIAAFAKDYFDYTVKIFYSIQNMTPALRFSPQNHVAMKIPQTHLAIVLALGFSALFSPIARSEETTLPPDKNGRPQIVGQDADGNLIDNRPGSGVVPDFADVAYGEHARQKYDVFQAPGNGPRPFVFFVHGGGWQRLDKALIRKNRLTQKILDSGISIVSANYRYSSQATYPSMILDAARALQDVRHNAAKYNLDPKRVAGFGGSAGATTVLWLALNDDLAKPDSADPVARESTRLQAVAAVSAQTTLDPKVMKEWVGGNPYNGMLPAAFGVKDGKTFEDPEIQKLVADASVINKVSSDDPPVLLNYTGKDEDIPDKESGGLLLHHPRMGKKMLAALKEAGVEVSFMGYAGEKEGPHPEEIDFFVTHLQP